MKLGAGMAAFEMSAVERASILIADRINNGGVLDWDTGKWSDG